jgi:hypothetical protein
MSTSYFYSSIFFLSVFSFSAFAQNEPGKTFSGGTTSIDFSSFNINAEAETRNSDFVSDLSIEAYPLKRSFITQYFTISDELPKGVFGDEYTYNHVSLGVIIKPFSEYYVREKDVTKREMFELVSAFTYQNKNAVQYFLGITQNNTSSIPIYHNYNYSKVNSGIVFGVNYYFKVKK